LGTLGDEAMDTAIPDFQSLMARVERLERQYDWFKSEVVTEKLVVVDAAGKTRATLCMYEEGPGLGIYDTDGNRCAVLRVCAEGPSLRLVDRKTGQGLELMVLNDGPSVHLFDANGKPSVLVTILNHGGGLTLYGPDVKARLILDVSESGKSSLTMKDANGGVVVKLAPESDGPCLLFRKHGKMSWSAP
jgi:hypothetical protein